MGARGVVGRWVARAGVWIAGDELFGPAPEPGFRESPDAVVAFDLTPEGRAMITPSSPPPRQETIRPAPLEGSAADLIERRRGVRR
jgi:hypothetical protein